MKKVLNKLKSIRRIFYLVLTFLLSFVCVTLQTFINETNNG